ncbi:hypothetical protein P7C73_g1748, partial [Tremellales sp. Uapishka_1]
MSRSVDDTSVKLERGAFDTSAFSAAGAAIMRFVLANPHSRLTSRLVFNPSSKSINIFADSTSTPMTRNGMSELITFAPVFEKVFINA